MRFENELDLARVDVEAAGDDQLFDPPADRKRAVPADLAHVTGAEESIGCEGLVGGLWVAPVAGENLAALEEHLVELAELHLDTGKRIADAARLTRALVRIRHHDSALGDAVALDGRLA